jgi:gliding motility-associated-like protein
VAATVNPLPIAPTITSTKAPVNGTVLLCTENSETTTLATSPAGYAGYAWSSGQTTPSIATNQSGSITVRVTDANGCQSVASAALTIKSTSCKPSIATATFNTTTGGRVSQSILSLITVVSTLNPASLKIVTQPASGAIASIDANGLLIVNYSGIQFVGKETVIIEVCDTNGICATQSIVIEVEGDVVVFNAISPNGDGKNEFLRFQNIELLPDTRENKVTIFSRGGDIVFEVENYDNAGRVFKGMTTSGDPVAPGTYFYRIDFRSGLRPRTGFISVKK